jgi:hypothetical protein
MPGSEMQDRITAPAAAQSETAVPPKVAFETDGPKATVNGRKIVSKD